MALTQISTGGIKDDAVTDAKLPANSVGNSEMKDDAVGVAELSATGTAGNTTFLRGDNSWQAISTTPEGTSILSTGETGTAKFLRVDGDNSCSWQVPPDTNTQVGGATGVDFNDDIKSRWGTGNDIEIYHRSSDDSAIIKNVNDTGFLRILSGDTDSSGILLKNRDDGVTYLRAKNHDGIELFFNDSVKFETTSSGVTVTGDLGVGGAVNLTGTSTGTGTNGGMYRHSNGWTYYQAKSDGNGAVLSNGDGTATVKAVSPGGSNGYISIESGDGTERARITSGGHVLIGDEGNDNAFFKAHAADGEASDLYVGRFVNAEATAGVNYGVEIQGGSNSTDHGFRVKNHAGTAQFLVRGDGNVGIGTGSPDTLLHLSGADTAVIRLENTDSSLGQDQLVGGIEWESNDGSGAGAGVFGGIRLRSDDSYGARSYMAFSTRENSSGAAATDTEQFRILSQGGVTFNGDTAEANALDDYEEGTFTPTWNNVTNASTHAVWNYIKVGKLVHVSGWFKCNTTTNSGSDGVSASGLPFTTAANPTNGYIGFVGNIVYENINSYSSGNFATLLTDNSSTFYPYKCQQNGGWENLRSDDVSANDYMIISFCYRI